MMDCNASTGFLQISFHLCCSAYWRGTATRIVASCDCAGAGAAAVERAKAVAGKLGSACPGTGA
eukprot:7451857-Alexandrium_andersonii.AAC.1